VRLGREAFALGLLTLLMAAPSAHAACDWPVAKARATHVARGATAPLAIGDSTMIYAVPQLARRGVEANARVCRSVAEGLDIMRARKRAGRLPSLVILALGANSPVRAADVRTALRILGPDRTLGLVTHRTWFGKPGPDTRTIRQIARRHRTRVRLVDWVAYAAPHPSWFVIDGLHTNTLGSRKFAAFLAGAARASAS
jgi:lysophospholipase L1-like esterase